MSVTSAQQWREFAQQLRAIAQACGRSELLFVAEAAQNVAMAAELEHRLLASPANECPACGWVRQGPARSTAP